MVATPLFGGERCGDGMGESRDAVKAATEIGVIMMGRPVQNNHRHSVIPVTFRGSRPRVDIGMVGALAPS
jgi:hypothetical protein